MSYNHLGNNDGMNLSAPQTFRSKEISKSNVVDDMVASNGILFEPGEHPDHVVVIKVKREPDRHSRPFSVGRFQYPLIQFVCLFCSMYPMLRIVSERWTSTHQRSSWEGRTQL